MEGNVCPRKGASAMYRVLIVDDAVNARRGLIEGFDWAAVNCEVAGEAENGQTALRLIDELLPDIVVCDIDMPGQSGIHVAQVVKEKDNDLKIIFVTGYDNFDYAKEAVSNRVFDYLLKPLDFALLRSAVEGACEALARARRLKEENERFRAGLESYKPVLRDNFILQLIKQQLTDGEDIALKAAFFGMQCSFYQLVMLEFDHYAENIVHLNEYERQLLFYTAKNLIGEIAGKYGSVYLVETDVNRLLLLLGTEETRNAVALMEEACAACKTNLNLSLSCGLSEWFADLADAAVACEQATAALASKFYLGVGSITHIYDLQSPPYRQMNRPQQGGDFSTEMKKLFKRFNADDAPLLADGLADLFEAALGPATAAGEDAIRGKSLAIAFIATMIRELEQIGVNGAAIVEEEMSYALVLKLETLSDILAYIRELAQTMIRINEKQRNLSYSLAVDQAVAYINAHYAEELSLNDVAGAVHMNPSYLSRVIKKVTGANFVDILLRARMDRAKILLKRLDYKTYEVAERVGIPDSKYFSSVFKRETGLTPTEYRNRPPGG